MHHPPGPESLLSVNAADGSRWAKVALIRYATDGEKIIAFNMSTARTLITKLNILASSNVIL